MDFFTISKRFENYYDLLFQKYYVYGFITFIIKTVFSVVMSKYIHWSLGLIISLIVTTFEYFSIGRMRDKIPEGGLWHSILNIIPGMVYTHFWTHKYINIK